MPKSHLKKSLFILFVCFIFKASDDWFEFGTPLKEINGRCITANETMNIFNEKETPPYLTYQY